MEVAMRLARSIDEINNIPEYDFDHQTQRREMITQAIQKAMQEYSSIHNQELKMALKELSDFVDRMNISPIAGKPIRDNAKKLLNQ